MTDEQMHQIETIVNKKIREAVSVDVKVYEEGDKTLREVIILIETFRIKLIYMYVNFFLGENKRFTRRSSWRCTSCYNDGN